MNYLDDMGPPSGIKIKTEVFMKTPANSYDAFSFCVERMGLGAVTLRKLLLSYNVFPTPSRKAVASVLRGYDGVPPIWWVVLRQEWHRRLKASLELVARFEASGAVGLAAPESELKNPRLVEILAIAMLHLPGETPAKFICTKKPK